MNNVTLGQSVNSFMEDFRKHRGRCYTHIFIENYAYVIAKELIVSAISKNKDTRILIVLGSEELLNKITLQLKIDLGEDVVNRGNISFIGYQYMSNRYTYKNTIGISIGVNANKFAIDKINKDCTFVLHIFSIRFSTNVNEFFGTNLHNIEFNSKINNNVLSRSINGYLLGSLPVEERHISVTLDNEDKEQYDKCCSIITNISKAFGDIDNIKFGLHGDASRNISAKRYCYDVAINNGWNKNLDTSIDYQKQIDEEFNPNVLYEKARAFFNVVPLRKQIVSDCDAKLPIIYDICIKHSGKKIIIVSSRGEFANKVADYLRNKGIDCGEYHGDIPATSAVDVDGKLLTYKSGKRKGETKVLGAQAQSSLYKERFNLDLISCISVKNKCNRELDLRFDVVIFTSAFCDDYYTWFSNYRNILANNKNPKSYRVYVENTIEENAIRKMKVHPSVTIIEEEKEVMYNEENGDVIL